jgi:thymidylate synthase ThyX
MTITAKIVADSVSPEGIRLTTLQLRYPKFIHGEFMTHRVFSRNASSSRAIPVARLVQDVLDDPAIPIHWGANQKGMQAEKECDALIELNPLEHWAKDAYTNVESWLAARDHAVSYARAFDDAGYHKQIVNRLLEPFCHINVVVTATEWSNFFALRCHPAAQPEMRMLADMMREAMEKSKPRFILPGEWHLPYIFPRQSVVEEVLVDDVGVGLNWAIKASVARCARVSYLTQEGKAPSVEEDLALYDRLMSSVPLHASPAEHQATPDRPNPYKGEWRSSYLHGNFKGWIQYRKTLVGECQ